MLIRRFGPVGLLLAPVTWVSAEYARAHIFGGFPWIPLGNAVVSLLPLAQLASVAGVYGLSWLLALLHALFAYVAMTSGHRRVGAIVAAIALVAVTSLWGACANSRRAAHARGNRSAGRIDSGERPAIGEVGTIAR